MSNDRSGAFMTEPIRRSDIEYEYETQLIACRGTGVEAHTCSDLGYPYPCSGCVVRMQTARIAELDGQVAGLIEMLGTADFDHFVEWETPFEGWHVSSVIDPNEICLSRPPCSCCMDRMVQGDYRALSALREAKLTDAKERHDA